MKRIARSMVSMAAVAAFTAGGVVQAATLEDVEQSSIRTRTVFPAIRGCRWGR